jgi:putative membrane protein
MRLLIRWLINAVVLYFLAMYLPDLNISSFYTALIIVLVFGLVNAVIGGILKLLTLPINILTLGIGCLFINALMFWLTSTIVKGFEVAGFWPAFVAALIYTVATTMINWLVKK